MKWQCIQRNQLVMNCAALGALKTIRNFAELSSNGGPHDKEDWNAEGVALKGWP